MKMKIHPGKYEGLLQCNPSKSVMQRVVAAAYLADGKTTILNPDYSNDSKAALSIIERLGASVLNTGSSVVITGNPVSTNVHELSCGESGLGIRMFTPIVALLENEVSVTGEGSLKSRPMHFFEEVLPKLGVYCTSNNGKVPITVRGPMTGNTITINGSLTSQFLTGLLMALPTVNADSVVKVSDLKSHGYIDLTLATTKAFGVEIINGNYTRFRISGRQKYQPTTIEIEGDWSGAAFHVVAGAISQSAQLKKIQAESAQPDRQILEVVRLAGAKVRSSTNSVEVEKNNLSAFVFDATNCPDLFPPIAALAANCIGTSVIKGISRLTHKESNRALSIQSELGKLGIEVQLIGDEMHITGGKILGGTIHSNNDHRIAMMGAILALNAKSEIIIEHAEAINKSYPAFFEDLKTLGIDCREC